MNGIRFLERLTFFIVLAGLLATLASAAWDLQIDNTEMVAIISLTVGAIVLIPLIYSNFINPVGIYVWFVLIVLLSMPVRWIFLTRLVSEGPIFILLHKDLTQFVPGALVASLAILCVVAGYLSGGRQQLIEPRKIIAWGEIVEGKFSLFISLAVLISMSAMAIYLKETGFSLADLSSISAKRSAASGADVDGYLRRLCDMIYMLTIITAAFSTKSQSRYASYLKRLAWFTASLAIFWAVASSVRAGIIFVALSLMAIQAQARRREFPIGILIIAILLGNFAFTFISSARKGNTDITAITTDFIEFRGLESIATAGNLGGTIFTQHMMDLVPSTIEYQNGGTFAYIFIAPIPRDVWPDKPKALGALLEDYMGSQTAARRGGGMATGLVGEILLNFGVWGIVPIMVLFGVLMRLVENTFSPIATQSAAAIALQQTLAISIVYNLYGYNLARGGVDLIFSMLVFTMILWLSSGNHKNKSTNLHPTTLKNLQSLK